MAQLTNNATLGLDELTIGSPLHAYPLFELRSLFYLVLPSELAFSYMGEMSSSVAIIAPFFALELLVALLEHRLWLFDPIDCFASLIAMAVLLLEKSFVRMSEFALYEFVHARFAIVHFSDPTSISLFIFALFAIDFVRYWEHRAWHENHVLWQVHKLHHSSEYMNLFTGARTSYIHQLSTIILHTPLALVIPPAQFYAHYYINYFYPFWVHTTVIPKFRWRPLERFFITPSHHRVHHGRNRYCIDRNYGQLLIIWDLMFGTFAEERENEQVVYGVLEPVTTYNTARMHFDYSAVWKKFSAMPTRADKFRSLLYGPGWMPGKPRLGDPEDVPDVRAESQIVEARFVIAHSRVMGFCFMFHCMLETAVCLHAAALVPKGDQLLITAGHLCAYSLLYTLATSLDEVNTRSIACQAMAHCGLVVYALAANYDLRLVAASWTVLFVECVVHVYEHGRLESGKRYNIQYK